MAKRKTKAATKRSTTTQSRASRPQPVATTSFNQLVVSMVTFWLSNIILLLVGNAFFPHLVVLGTHTLSSLMGAVYAGAVIALVGVGAIPVIEYTATMWRTKLTDMHWMALYLVINTAAVWVVSRFPEMLGLGIRFWWIALVFGVVFDVVQGMLMSMVVSKS